MNDGRANDPRVLVVGGGVGGLALAQGLKKAGIDVAVYERDRSPHSRSQGYRIHINAFGEEALKRCLPENLYQLFKATSGEPPSGMHAQYDPQLNEVYSRPLPSRSGDAAISPSGEANRLTLREILLHGMDDVVHFGRALERVEPLENGRVLAHFSGGRAVEGDVLIGADGTHSTVRRHLLPDAGISEVGFAIYGKTPLTASALAWIPENLITGFSRVADASGVAMIFGVYRKRESFDTARASFAPKIRLTSTEDYLMWTFRASAEQMGLSQPDLQRAEPATLHTTVKSLITGWQPSVRRIVDEADIPATFFVRFYASREVQPWQTTNVTLLGDAIHTMPPFRGVGANTALRDADLLCNKLAEAAGRGAGLVEALSEYERTMLQYGFEAVRQSVEKPFFGASGHL